MLKLTDKDANDISDIWGGGGRRFEGDAGCAPPYIRQENVPNSRRSLIVSGVGNTYIIIQHQKWNERKTIKTSWRFGQASPFTI